jgi:hypothetical protein|tara:strand:+ start:1300 stop:1473 length:174 start_codon:yes stop_codon:yes gene_type:complete
MRVGDLVRFKTNDLELDWKVGLLLRYDKFTKVAEILKDDHLYYAPGRLVNVHQRGYK